MSELTSTTINIKGSRLVTDDELLRGAELIEPEDYARAYPELLRLAQRLAQRPAAPPSEGRDAEVVEAIASAHEDGYKRGMEEAKRACVKCYKPATWFIGTARVPYCDEHAEKCPTHVGAGKKRVEISRIAISADTQPVGEKS